jgi:hypothetical protein
MRNLTALTCVLALGVGLAHAADQTIVGKLLLVKDPKPGVDATKRKIVAQGKEKASGNTIVGVGVPQPLPGTADGRHGAGGRLRRRRHLRPTLEVDAGRPLGPEVTRSPRGQRLT